MGRRKPAEGGAVISVLNETRVVEEREMKDGKLIEVSRNYLAMSRASGEVYYFGFERCLRIRESSSVKSGSEDKLYAPDVELIKDGNMVLVGVDCPLCKGTKVIP